MTNVTRAWKDSSSETSAFLQMAVPEQSACGSSGRPSSASWPCPLAGSSSHPPHGSKRIDCHHRTEMNIYLETKYSEWPVWWGTSFTSYMRNLMTIICCSKFSYLCISCPDKLLQSNQQPGKNMTLKMATKRLSLWNAASSRLTFPRRSPLLKGWYGISLNFSGTAHGPHPDGLSWITGALNLAMAWVDMKSGSLKGPRVATVFKVFHLICSAHVKGLSQRTALFLQQCSQTHWSACAVG